MADAGREPGRRLVLIQGEAALDVADLSAGRFEFSTAAR